MADGTIHVTALRSLLGGFAIGTVALLAVAQVGAQALAGHDSDAPVSYAADRIELQDKANRVILSGNVDIAQGGLRLKADRTTVAYTNNGSIKIQRIDATGGVLVTRGNESARGDVAIYDFNQRIITLAGGVGLNRGSDTLNGGRLVIDLKSGLSSVDGGSGGVPGASGGSGRVSGTFQVPKRTN